MRQPWADKEVAQAVLNDEQKAYLEQVAKEKAEKAEEEADKGPKVPTCYIMILTSPGCTHPLSLPGEL